MEALKTLFEFLFVPKEENITGITDLVSSKFSFIDSIKTAINSFEDILTNVGRAPSLSVSIGSTKYTSSQYVKVIDLSWYTPFKSYGDVILTGFIYAFFLWRLFISIPNIINGVGGVSYIIGREGSGKH